MPRATRLKLALIKLGLFCATAFGSLACLHPCPTPVQGPPKVSCPLPPAPTPPATSPGSDAAGNVTLTPEEAVDLGQYLRDLQHWEEVATACLGTPAKAWAYDAEEVGTNLSMVDLDLQREALLLNPRPALVAADCGTINAFYLPSQDVVVVCRELVRYLADVGHPGAIRVVLAHELGHAMIHELDLPVTGSEESAADEFANAILPLLSRMTGDPRYADAVLDIGRLYLERAQPEFPLDDHPSDLRRAGEALCMHAGATEPDSHPACARRYRAVIRVWNRLLDKFGA